MTWSPNEGQDWCRMTPALSPRVYRRAPRLPSGPGHRSIQIYASVYTDGDEMAKASVGARQGPGDRRRRPSRRAGWVRKNVVMDQRKLDVARRALGVDTETEAIDQALDFIDFGNGVAPGC